MNMVAVVAMLVIVTSVAIDIMDSPVIIPESNFWNGRKQQIYPAQSKAK